MPRLTDTQTILLAAAVARSDLGVLPAPERLTVEPADLDRALRSLLRRKLIAVRCEMEGKGRSGAGRSASAENLQITPGGLVAIGVVDEPAAPSGGGRVAEEPAVTLDVDPMPPKRPRRNRARATDEETHPAETGSLAPGRAGGAAAALDEDAAPDRPMTKKARLIALLSTEAGADVPFLSAALGLQRHSTRAALTVLRRSGYQIETAKSQKGEVRLYRIVE